MTEPTTYWNHNVAYHPWVLRMARRHRGRVLDVGCGDGLLVERLAAVSDSVTGIEPDPPTLERARRRLSQHQRVTLEETGFADYHAAAPFDLIVFLASLHHMDLRATLRQASELLAPGGELAVVGLAANATARDWAIAGASLPLVRLGSALHHETRDIGVPVAESRDSLARIRSVAGELLPGARIRRGLYYRYLLRWRRPSLTTSPR